MLSLSMFLPLLQRAAWFGALVLLDFLTGVIKALVSHTFSWKRVADVLKNNAGYFLGWLAIDFTTLVAAQLGLPEIVNTLAGGGALALFTATTVRSILGNVSAILNALNLVGAEGAVG